MHKKKRFLFAKERKSPSLSVFVNFSFVDKIKSWSDWLANVTTRSYEFCTVESHRVSWTLVISWGAQLTRGPRGDARQYLRRNVFFNVFYDTLDGQTDGRGKWRKMTIIRRGCVAVQLHRRAKTVGNVSSRGGSGKKRGKNHEIDTCEIEGKVLLPADDSRDGRASKALFRC